MATSLHSRKISRFYVTVEICQERSIVTMQTSRNKIQQLASEAGVDKYIIQQWIRLEGEESAIRKIQKYIERNKSRLTAQRKEREKSNKEKQTHYNTYVKGGKKIVRSQVVKHLK